VGGVDPVVGAGSFVGSTLLVERVGSFDSVGTFNTAFESVHALPLDNVLYESIMFLDGMYHQRIRIYTCAASLLAFRRWCHI
jgi:hypothetical protein